MPAGRGGAKREQSHKTERDDVLVVEDPAKGLAVRVHRGWAGAARAARLFDEIADRARWRRVRYRSARYGRACATPCWTSVYGGPCPGAPGYAPVPAWLRPLAADAARAAGAPFNVVLLRLYLDGRDHIAWHTDGRAFLGPRPTIASLSLGATAAFELRRMRCCWPSLAAGSDDGVDAATPVVRLALAHGDLLVMHGDTQRHWHHRVPPAARRRPRINLNFRYIPPGPRAAGGQETYYKYLRWGDDGAEKSDKNSGRAYHDLVRAAAPLLAAFGPTTQKMTPPSKKKTRLGDAKK